MNPFEFVVEGPPISLQTRNRGNLQAWKAKVLNSARLKWPNTDSPLTEENLKLTVTYYYEDVYPDVDNIIKPIQDALVGLVYNNDSQISDTRSKRRNINASFRVKGMSPVLAQGFVLNKEFLHVKIEHDSNQEVLE